MTPGNTWPEPEHHDRVTRVYLAVIRSRNRLYGFAASLSAFFLQRQGRALITGNIRPAFLYAERYRESSALPDTIAEWIQYS
jgi:hypothetical protein